VTAILPHPRNIFREKVEAAVHVINGFGKSAGLLQIQELGVIESPILLTNTLSVAAVLEGAVEHMIQQSPDIGISTGTVNCVVGECNDGFLNDIQGRHVRPDHALEAILTASSGLPAEGSVGAGTGMVCYGYKGGIGTASRVTSGFTVGTMVLSNFGRREHLMVGGMPVGQKESESRHDAAQPGDGSVMIVVATDAPLDSRQLGRLARRGAMGLARTGSVASHGSGDFVIAFSTSNRRPHYPEGPLRETRLLHEDGAILTNLFQAVVESVEEAVVNSLFAAAEMTGRDGHRVPALPIEQVSGYVKER
jgi:D-aminopeptidase